MSQHEVKERPAPVEKEAAAGAQPIGPALLAETSPALQAEGSRVQGPRQAFTSAWQSLW